MYYFFKYYRRDVLPFLEANPTARVLGSPYGLNHGIWSVFIPKDIHK